MYISREKLNDIAERYEKSKLHDSFACTPNLTRTLQLGKMMMGKLLTGNTKSVNHTKKATKLWQRYLGMEAVSRRIYLGVPDCISFRTDYFCSLLICGEHKIFQSLALLGYLVRYGFWNTDGYLVMDISNRSFYSDEIDMDMKVFHSHMLNLLKHQLLIKVVEVDRKEMFKLNPDIVMLLNERTQFNEHSHLREVIFTEEKHKTKS